MDTGLVRFGFRDYDPDVGRWTAKDPIGFGGGLSLYEYTRSNPIQFLDSQGQSSEEAFVNISIPGMTVGFPLTEGSEPQVSFSTTFLAIGVEYYPCGCKLDPDPVRNNALWGAGIGFSSDGHGDNQSIFISAGVLNPPYSVGYDFKTAIDDIIRPATESFVEFSRPNLQGVVDCFQ